MPRALDLKEPTWFVVSEKNLEEFLEIMGGDDIVFFAMSVPDYELMAYNMQELRRYIKQVNEIIVYYRKVTTTEEGGDEGASSTVKDR